MLNLVTPSALASGHLYCLYSIIAPVLAFWIKFAILEEEPAYETFSRLVGLYLKQTEEPIARLSTELGIANQSQLLELISYFHPGGQSLILRSPSQYQTLKVSIGHWALN